MEKEENKEKREGVYKLIISASHVVGDKDERVADFASTTWRSGDVVGALEVGKTIAIKKWPVKDGYSDHNATQNHFF
ncbi:MAG: hypothetical protein UR39_C0002G0027 [Candidatus Woesebacteria bacterium GW2011_GWA1_33_30]|uniref:Uncharacterized protein n=1 Tax=Candidatus Woesebacteria bacterium GW2011_GWA2_33_28 TaxID=1618561 RepID=A0A0F9ZUJ4_9BACT|nr:MAG: hypothetical protein UR38_C0002G0027 [Candidatus Woesebacteria bacterium GW2011_GWA2_33_28]KKP48737.1 MAG: hypothetical protein UR39_C0002G0027 [Candidatus Woesebacteria bacterium GW2011_GWA1_33_30]KKP50010.1 MAG: hypothetical protein UR40_C0002G0027 [Microgenomates group bacterium GW2011_GWC1_33_32]KKP51781.1 MAG: hypothetical protein UR44_C0006G0027 [Candidatus Woesebacteria bacterium GW2011_GWB1_33_38]KKP58605.1 MAG: hypothetical protein UR48_C0003G0032 [Microgenomates group bacteriu